MPDLRDGDASTWEPFVESQADHHGCSVRRDADDRGWRTSRPDQREIVTGVLTDTRGHPLPDLHTADPPLVPQLA